MERKELLRLLRKGAKKRCCGIYLHHLSGVERTRIYQNLETERLERKYREVSDYYGECRDWNQIFLVQFMRSMSDMHNKENYMEIAKRIGYSTLMRERGSLRNIEDMLLVASGLLDFLPRDSFMDDVCSNGRYLLKKYSITPLTRNQWVRKSPRITFGGFILKLLQVARLVYDNDLIFNRLVAIKNRNDILTLFNVVASERWSDYMGSESHRRLPIDKRDIIGINFVVPMLYAYGHYTSDETISDAATDLNEMLPAEVNKYTREWREYGLVPVCAYETQALIQLTTEYCGSKSSRCEECFIFQHLSSAASKLGDIPRFLTELSGL